MTVWIAESGGSKTDWLILDKQAQPIHFRTVGLNPHVHGWDQVAAAFAEVSQHHRTADCEELLFFGAGLGDSAVQERMGNLLTKIFTQASIRVHSDLIAAGFACLGNQPGLVGILGTGSVAFRFENGAITKRAGGWGYLLGDPGSAAATGQAFLKSLIANQLPHHLATAHESETGQSASKWKEELYSAASPVPLFCSQVPFISKHRHDAHIAQLLERQFHQFINEILSPLNPRDGEMIHLVGGMAKEFAATLHACAQMKSWRFHIQTTSPIFGIVKGLGQGAVDLTTYNIEDPTFQSQAPA